MNKDTMIFGYEEWQDAYKILEAEIELMDRNKHFNTLNLQYFKNLEDEYKKYVLTEEFFNKYINNGVFFGLEDVVFNYIYYIPKNMFSYRKMSYNSFLVRIIHNAIGIYLFKLSKELVDDFINTKESCISSRYGGKIEYTQRGITTNQENLYYRKQYKDFVKELLSYINNKDNNRIIIKLDVQDFYDNIIVDQFLSVLSDNIKFSVKEKFKFDNNKIENISDFYKYIMHGKNGIPQSDNDIVSSFISSLYMKLVDIDIVSLINNMKLNNLEKYKIIQYCDDTYIILDFIKYEKDNMYISVNRILEDISLKLTQKYNLKFNNKSKIFDLLEKSDIEELKSCIKVNSQTEIELERGERPQRIFDNIINELNKINTGAIGEFKEEESLEVLKKIYNKSVYEIMKKKDNLKLLKETMKNFKYEKAFLSVRYIVTLACMNEDTKRNLIQYIENKDSQNINKFLYVLEYISKENFKYINNIEDDILMNRFKTIFTFQYLNQNSLGYMNLNNEEFEKLYLFESNCIISQTRYRRIEEVSKNYNIAFNHLVNEVKSIINEKYSKDIEEKNYKVNNVKEDLSKEGYDVQTIIDICNMFDRRNNNAISHSNGRIIDEEEYFKYKNSVCELLKEMVKMLNK